MSALGMDNQMGPAVSRVRAAGRSRRAEEGHVTEMARLLIRDAREAGGGQAEAGQTAAERPHIGVRRRRAASGAGRLTSRPLAARRA
ncbi:MAG TPA: hypothetical protein VH061_06305 [Solirubrobacteraceae bacterium]|jgi:hypothetical protein|nr:hypothetical protein [Solirubrobacteraceae bacterium]